MQMQQHLEQSENSKGKGMPQLTKQKLTPRQCGTVHAHPYGCTSLVCKGSFFFRCSKVDSFQF
jgi:hypothetical protein